MSASSSRPGLAEGVVFVAGDDEAATTTAHEREGRLLVEQLRALDRGRQLSAAQETSGGQAMPLISLARWLGGRVAKWRRRG